MLSRASKALLMLRGPQSWERPSSFGLQKVILALPHHATTMDQDLFTAVILVGGPTRGTRFRPLGLDIAKPLFPVGGKPLIYHHISACVNHFGDKMFKIFLLGSYEDDTFTKFIASTKSELGVDIEYLKENTALGTAGGLFHFRQQILPQNVTHFFLLHADTVCTFPLEDMLKFHKNHGKMATMLGVRVSPKVAQSYGCYVADEKTHRMLHYAEKPESFISDTINAGVYLFGRQALQVTIKRTPSKNDLFAFPESRTESSEKLSMEYDVLPSLASDGVAYVLEYKEFWGTMKSAGSAAYCNEQYLRYYSKARPEILTKGDNLVGAVMIDPSAQVHPTAKIGPFVYIGPKTVIGPGVRISNSIVLSNVHIKDHACVLHSILSEDCVVGQWTRLEGLPTADSKRDRICVFGRAVTVSPEIIIHNCIVMPYKTLEQSYFDEILL